MRHWMVMLVLVGLVAAAMALPKRLERAPTGPKFEADEYSLTVTKLKNDSVVNFDDRVKTKYTIAVDAFARCPDDKDIVAIREKFTVKAAKDDRQQNILKPKRRRSLPFTSAKLNYSAFVKRLAPVEVPKTELTRNAHALESMTLGTNVVIAKQRTEKVFTATVMEEFKELSPGLSIRISDLKMGTKRKLRITAEYRRSVAGTSGAFIEDVHVLDKEGNEIGRGRWTEGTPFGKKGKFIGEYQLSGVQVHESFRFVAVTDYHTKSLTFEVEGVFQK